MKQLTHLVFRSDQQMEILIGSLIIAVWLIIGLFLIVGTSSLFFLLG